MLPISGGIIFKSSDIIKKLPIQTYSPEFIYLDIPEGYTHNVSVNENVYVGQAIATNQSDISHPIYSGISGVVCEISDNTVVIKNDFKNLVYSGISAVEIPLKDMRERDIENISHLMGIYDKGTPLSFKIKESLGKIENIVIRGIDTDPPAGITNRLITEKCKELIGGIKILIHATRARTGIIAVDEKSHDVISTLKKNISDPKLILIRGVERKYPIDNEKVLLFALTRKEYQDDNIIKDGKILVLDAETAINVYNSFTTGLPNTNKIFTVSGRVKNVKNICAPIGTKISNILDYCGGRTIDDGLIIQNGIMNGETINEDSTISHSTNSISIIEGKDSLATDCIRCGKCIKACPMLLKPLFIYSNILKEKDFQNVKLGVNNCILCGCCSYVCPSKIPICETIKNTKRFANYKN